MIYDIIGDIHGQADKLKRLLDALGYRDYVPPKGRCAIFVGDLIDRGPKQIETLEIVFGMLDKGHARCIMGNHEFNALAFSTPNKTTGHMLRPHSARNVYHHHAFLQEAPYQSPLYWHWIGRLFELPLYLDLPKLRVVHAYWSPRAICYLKTHLDNAQLTPSILRDALPGTVLRTALDALLNGLEVDLPHGESFLDIQGTRRYRVRVRWWQNNWHTLPLEQSAQLTDTQLSTLSDTARAHFPKGPDAEVDCDSRPVFFGHYWFSGAPHILQNAVCVDYSAALDGDLVAYAFDTQNPTLDNRHFVRV